jgi:mannose-1-phosphate guanylyltransferase / mannose-6-phosphate isomerase
MQTIHPLILCGGVGTRLWPLSRTEHPKQFQRIEGTTGRTFFHATIERQRQPGFSDPIVAVSSAHVGTVLQQLHELNCPARIIAEPLSRNTGPAVLATALTLAETQPDALMCVLPSDHIVRGDLAACVLAMRPAAQSGRIVLFGVQPEYPETGYGYIVDGGLLDDVPGARSVASFVEKPPFDVASRLIASGNALWSSGISLFRADVLISEFQRLDPATLAAVRASLALAEETDHAIFLDEDSFSAATNQPTESIIFEQSPLTVVAPLAVRWNDVGAWSALHQIADKNEDGNVISGDVVCIDSRNSYIRASDKLIAVVGMDNVVVVDTDDALLVTSHDKAQQVKQVVKQLEAIKRRELMQHARNQMTWGEVRRIQEGPGYELRLMTLRPGTAITFSEDPESHRMLTIAEGRGVFKGDAGTKPLTTGETLEIPMGASGVIYCSPEEPMQIVEVSCSTVVEAVAAQAASLQMAGE